MLSVRTDGLCTYGRTIRPSPFVWMTLPLWDLEHVPDGRLWFRSVLNNAAAAVAMMKGTTTIRQEEEEEAAETTTRTRKATATTTKRRRRRRRNDRQGHHDTTTVFILLLLLLLLLHHNNNNMRMVTIHRWHAHFLRSCRCRREKLPCAEQNVNRTLVISYSYKNKFN